jgi:hypothetical protein
MANFNPAFAPMYALYGGNLKCVINEVTYLLNWDLGRHIADDTTQTQESAAGVSSTLTEVKGNSTAFFPVNPGIVLNGQGKNEFTVQMPNNQLAPVAPIAYNPQTGAAYTIAIDQIVMILRGNLAQNASGAN